MEFPEDFNPYEHLLSVYRQEINAIVRREFGDVAGDDKFTDISSITGRTSHYIACTHQADDTEGMTKMRTDLFYIVGGKAAALQAPIYGIPVSTYQESRSTKPQIQLYFSEKQTEVEKGYDPLRSEVTFRLMGKDEKTMSMAEIKEIALKIKSLFATGNHFSWKRGKDMYSYTEKAKGYQFQLLAWDMATAKTVATKVLEIQNHVPNWKFLNHNQNAEPAERFPTIPPTVEILGKPVKQSRYRGVGTIYFRYALLHLHGLKHPIVLVDPDHYYQTALAR